MGVLYDSVAPFIVENFHIAYVDDIKSDIFEGNCKTTIAENYAYSLGVNIFTNQTTSLRFDHEECWGWI